MSHRRRTKINISSNGEDNPFSDRYSENLASHDAMTRMAKILFTWMHAPSEVIKREARETWIGRRRFLDLDVQASDGSWTLRRIYIRAQPSREIFRCDLPFNSTSKTEGTPENFNESANQGLRSPYPGLLKRARDRAARLPVLIAPMASRSGEKFIINRRITFWSCLKVWKPKLRSQVCLEGCEISLDWSEVFGALAGLVKWFFDVVASRVRREGWGSPTSQRAVMPTVYLSDLLRPPPWPPPGGGDLGLALRMRKADSA